LFCLSVFDFTFLYFLDKFTKSFREAGGILQFFISSYLNIMSAKFGLYFLSKQAWLMIFKKTNRPKKPAFYPKKTCLLQNLSGRNDYHE
jgi:hypothetical protein